MFNPNDEKLRRCLFSEICPSYLWMKFQQTKWELHVLRSDVRSLFLYNVKKKLVDSLFI